MCLVLIQIQILRQFLNGMYKNVNRTSTREKDDEKNFDRWDV